MIALYVAIALMVGLAIYLFMIFPSLKKSKDIDKFSGLDIAHRGLHDEHLPENSLPAFQAAISGGYAIEIDIHITKDDEIVVFHDYSVKRMCGEDKKIEDMTLEEIKRLRLKNTDLSIPTLKECLDTVNSAVPLLIEFKTESIELSNRLCPKANEILKDYKGIYFVQSFFPFVLSWYKKNSPHITRGQLSSRFKSDPLYKRLLGLLLTNFIARPHFISYEFEKKQRFILKLQRLFGARLACWTLRKKEDYQKATSDYDSYIFEKFIP